MHLGTARKHAKPVDEIGLSKPPSIHPVSNRQSGVGMRKKKCGCLNLSLIGCEGEAPSACPDKASNQRSAGCLKRHLVPGWLIHPVLLHMLGRLGCLMMTGVVDGAAGRHLLTVKT